MESKASSLTKLRDYLQQRRGRGKDAYCSPSRRTSMADITSWRPKRLDHMIRIQAKGGRKSNPIPVSLPGLIPVPLYDFVSVIGIYPLPPTVCHTVLYVCTSHCLYVCTSHCMLLCHTVYTVVYLYITLFCTPYCCMFVQRAVVCLYITLLYHAVVCLYITLFCTPHCCMFVHHAVVCLYITLLYVCASRCCMSVHHTAVCLSAVLHGCGGQWQEVGGRV